MYCDAFIPGVSCSAGAEQKLPETRERRSKRLEDYQGTPRKKEKFLNALDRREHEKNGEGRKITGPIV